MKKLLIASAVASSLLFYFGLPPQAVTALNSRVGEGPEGVIPVSAVHQAATVSTGRGEDSLELLIGWKADVSITERDRTITAWGGKLNRRFSIVTADSVLFESPELRRQAQVAIALHSGVEEVQLVEPPLVPESFSGASSVPTATVGPRRTTTSAHTGQAGPQVLSSQVERDYPYPRWRHADFIGEAQRFAGRKREVVVAILSDRPRDSELENLLPALWENAAEKNGVAGVDDDGNGYVDDVHGIDTINRENQDVDWPTAGGGVALLVARIGNYDPERLYDPQVKVKLMPITAFYELSDEPRCNVLGRPYVRSTDTAVIEALEYAAKMGADIAFVSGHYVHKPSPLVLAAAEAFPGLIVTAPDRTIDDTCFFERSTLLRSGLANVVGVAGSTPLGERIAGWTGGPVDLTALLPYETRGAEGCAGIVAGFAAHLMSCYPQLGRSQIKDLLLGSVDRLATQIGRVRAFASLNRSGGKFNAARSVLGRSAGGMFYSGDWACIEREGPPNRSYFGLAYDPHKTLLYLYGGIRSSESQDEFWVWDGTQWTEIQQDKSAGHYPGPWPPEGLDQYYSIHFDQYNNRLLIVTDVAVWIWNGSQWLERKAPFPVPFARGGEIRDRFALDQRNGNIFYYYQDFDGKAIMAEFDGTQWNKLPVLAPLSSFPDSPLVHNANLGMVTTTSSREAYYRTDMWGFDGRRWRHLPMEKTFFIFGSVLFDAASDEYYLFQANNYERDIWSLKNGKWEYRGSDVPYISYETGPNYSAIWAEDQRKALFVKPGEFAEDNLALWQYSGSIMPTWIDNLILPQGDYRGSGRADLALWHPETGRFTVRNGKSHCLGAVGDIPVPGDYNGDGRIEFAVCRRIPGKPETRYWKIGSLLWMIGSAKITFGEFDDIPVPLDYDGDGKTNIAVFRKDTATWYFQGQKKGIRFGNPADLPVPADYDGDGKPELATYTPLTSTWHIQGIGDFQWGEPGDSPVPADYDGDGSKEIAIWNPRTATWLVRDWRDGRKLLKKKFGEKWDIPVPGDYNGNGKAELATYSPITTLWSIQGRTPVKFGSPGDVPLVRGN